LQVWNEVIKLNMISAMYLTRLAMPHLLRRVRVTGQPADIVFVSTSLCLERTQPMPGIAPYATSKAGLAAFAKVGLCVRACVCVCVCVCVICPRHYCVSHSLTLVVQVAMADVRDYGVRVSTIFPGLVNTEMGLKQGPVEKRTRRTVDPDILIQPEEIAEAVLFIAQTPANAAVTSITIQSQQHNVASVRKYADDFVRAQPKL
jgi:NAD(P)-dependent dehydrogenase (short-subunit alcohol dehydrogenase family)